ncbi:MAG: hypothetical protein ACRC2O_06685 [Chitinophagaceae bacterium]
MNEEKLLFLKKELIPLLQKIEPETNPLWGKMSLQQMIEHFSGAIKVATGTLRLPGTTEPADNGKYYSFLMSDKPFKENTSNPLLSEEPYALRNHTLQASISELQGNLLAFFQIFDNEEGKKVLNPIFGYLNYEEQVQLLYKHALHHLKQFGVEPLLKA